jgi:hypothetical protein
VENSLNSKVDRYILKIDRNECMVILENKASYNNLVKFCQDINIKMDNY